MRAHPPDYHSNSSDAARAHYVYLVDRPSVHRVPAPWAADPGAEARIPHSMDGCQRPGSGSRSSYVAVLVCWHGEKALLSRGEHRRRGLHLVGGCTSDYAGSAFCAMRLSRRQAAAAVPSGFIERGETLPLKFGCRLCVCCVHGLCEALCSGGSVII